MVGWDVSNGSANPQALLAAQIALRHDNLVTAAIDAAYQVAPDVAAAYVGLKTPGVGAADARGTYAAQVDAELASEAEGIIYRRTNPVTGPYGQKIQPTQALPDKDRIMRIVFRRMAERIWQRRPSRRDG